MRLGILVLIVLVPFLSLAARGAETIRSASLGERVSRPRWLSLPESRLVVNPRMGGYGQDPPVSLMTEAPLSLDLAYYVGEAPVRLPGLWSWQRQSPGTRRAGVHVGARLPFSTTEMPSWQANGVIPEITGDQLRLVVTAPSYGSLTRTVTVNLDETPTLMIQIAGGTGDWAVKVNAGDQAVDTPLIPDTRQIGTMSADIPAATGWRGTKTFKIILFAVGGSGRGVTFSRLQFFGRPDALQSGPGETVWFPHQIVTRAASRDRLMQVESTTCLLDGATVAQRLRVLGSSGRSLRLTGQFTSGAVQWDSTRHQVVLQGDRFQVVIALNHAARWLGVRPSVLGWLPGEASRDSPAGVWALALDDLKPGDEIVVSARFAPIRRGFAAKANTAPMPATGPQFAAALRRREADWNRRLAAVPHPQDFTPHAVPSLDVTATDIRRTYYRAWVFLEADTLPPMPENGFPYPQCACGKPSLWSEGAPHARPSAQWESFLAMQSLALVDPHTACTAYAGMMSLVGPDGSLNGEGLPSCHALTAWELYEQTGDTAWLRRVYPALKHFLLWKISDPRWIYKGSTASGQKDQQFVYHALLDIGYARRIAQALAMPGEAEFWQAQRRTLAQNFHQWFFAGPNAANYRIYDAPTGHRSGEDNAWNLSALTLPPDILTSVERDSLLASVQSKLRPNVPFLIPGLSRFADYEDAWKGLFQYGHLTEAAQLADAAMRDVTRAGEFSEVYRQDVVPQPDGVRPSVFGSRHAIDGVLWHNGVVYDEGLPVLLGTSQADGLTNLCVRGAPIRIVFTPTGNVTQVTLTGPGLRFLRLPAGFQVSRSSDHALSWRGSLALGARVPLEQP